MYRGKAACEDGITADLSELSQCPIHNSKAGMTHSTTAVREHSYSLEQVLYEISVNFMRILSQCVIMRNGEADVLFREAASDWADLFSERKKQVTWSDSNTIDHHGHL